MKKLMLAMVMALCALVMVGCGDKGAKVDESKTPEQIKQEVAKMDQAQIQKTIENYKNAIADKTAQMEKKAQELTKIPLTEQLGDKAKGLQGEIGTLKDQISKLQANMAAYAEGLKK